MNDLNNKQLEKLFKELKEIKQNQKVINAKIEDIQKAINHIENNIYIDDNFDFEIICPYCENEFIIDMSQNNDKIKCPECNNIIELDWSGDFDEMSKQQKQQKQSGCSGCAGCSARKFDEDDDM